MKCLLCERRKAVAVVHDKHIGDIEVCKTCRRDLYPTPAEELEDEEQEERRAERNAEFASAGDYW